MNPTINEFFSLLEDVDNSVELNKYFKVRDCQNLRIRNVTINFHPVGNKVEARMQVDYDDPKSKQPKEDLMITMELSGDRWKVKRIVEMKF